MWSIFTASQDQPQTRPSQSPDRREAILLSAESHSGNQQQLPERGAGLDGKICRLCTSKIPASLMLLKAPFSESCQGKLPLRPMQRRLMPVFRRWKSFWEQSSVPRWRLFTPKNQLGRKTPLAPPIHSGQQLALCAPTCTFVSVEGAPERLMKPGFRGVSDQAKNKAYRISLAPSGCPSPGGEGARGAHQKARGAIPAPFFIPSPRLLPGKPRFFSPGAFTHDGNLRGMTSPSRRRSPLRHRFWSRIFDYTTSKNELRS